MNQHTPGPWTSYPCNLERYSRVITAKGAMVQIAEIGVREEIAMTKEVYGDRMTYGPGEETTANARLIAAAPELLEACRNLMLSFAAFQIENSRNQIDETPEVIACRNAIIKATGEPA